MLDKFYHMSQVLSDVIDIKLDAPVFQIQSKIYDTMYCIIIDANGNIIEKQITQNMKYWGYVGTRDGSFPFFKNDIKKGINLFPTCLAKIENWSKNIPELLIFIEAFKKFRDKFELENIPKKTEVIMVDFSESIFKNTQLRDMLCKNIAKANQSTNIVKCSLSNEEGILFNAVYPSCRGKKIYSKAGKDNIDFCRVRYGLSDNQAFQITENTAKEIEASITYITDVNRQGKTWCNYGKDNLFLIYSDILLKDEAKDLPFTLYVNEDTKSKNHDAESKKFTHNLFLLSKKIPESKIYLMCIKKVSEGESTLVLNKTLNVDQYYRLSDKWIRNCFESDYDTNRFGDKKTYTLNDMVRILSPVYKGAKNSSWSSLSKEILNMLWENDINSVNIILERVNQLKRNEFRDLCKSTVKTIHPEWQIDYDVMKMNIPSFYVLTNYCKKLLKEKGITMRDYTYEMGALFAIADTIYFQYQEQVRKSSSFLNGISTEFITNISSRPWDTYNKFNSRFGVYKTWARYECNLINKFTFLNNKIGKLIEEDDTPWTTLEIANFWLGYNANMERIE